MLMEVMGLHLPGASFVNPDTPLRDALTDAAAGARGRRSPRSGNEYTPVGEIVDEKAIVNGSSALLATGGSTNHTLHLVAIAARRRHRARPGTTSPTSRRSCRCSPGSTRTARPT